MASSKENNHPIAAVILAAGKATRMKSNKAKVLQPIASRPMIHYLLDNVAKLDMKEVAMVIAPHMEEVQEEVSTHQQNVQFVVEKAQTGTGTSAKAGQEILRDFEGIILILYGDTPFITVETLQKMVATLQGDAALAILGFDAEDPLQYGRLVLADNGQLEAIVEYKDASEAERAITLCNAGVMAVKSEHLFRLLEQVNNDNAQKEYYLTDIVGLARSEGLSCEVISVAEDEVMGVNSFEELAHAEQVLQHRLRHEMMQKGVRLIAPDTVFFQYDTEIEPGAVIHPYVTFGTGVTVASGVEIKSYSHIEGAVIKENAIIGPFARLRPGAVIEEEAGIGNFVEIKQSVIGKESKVSHLTYIGDSQLGQKVNIGAGTITCNYDGYVKSQTTIEDNVFIGSNSSLVAPVTIGEGAIVGAGSTVVKDVQADALVMNEMPQKNIEGRAAEKRKEKTGG